MVGMNGIVQDVGWNVMSGKVMYNRVHARVHVIVHEIT